MQVQKEGGVHSVKMCELSLFLTYMHACTHSHALVWTEQSLQSRAHSCHYAQHTDTFKLDGNFARL